MAGINKTLALAGAATVVVGAGALSVLSANNTSQINAFGTSLYFPGDLGSEKHPYYMSFSFRQYQRRSIFNRQFLKDTGMIRLPIPNQLIDSSQANYDQAEGGLLTGAAIEQALKASNSSADRIKSFMSAGGQTATAGAVTAAIAAIPGGMNGPLTSQVLQLGGVAMNPFLTVLFKSPTFKRHVFRWTLNASNPSESETLRLLVNKFKYHQLPDLSGYVGGTLLSYPDICLVGIYPETNYLYKFKPCVIETCTINYANEGQPAFFAMTDAPVSVSLEISLLEIEYWLKGDILEEQGQSQNIENGISY